LFYNSVNKFNIFLNAYIHIYTYTYIYIYIPTQILKSRLLRGRSTHMSCLRLTHVRHDEFSYISFNSVLILEEIDKFYNLKVRLLSKALRRLLLILLFISKL